MDRTTDLNNDRNDLRDQPRSAGFVEQSRGCAVLAAVSLRRALRSRQTAVCGLLLAFTVLAVVAWSLRHDRTAQEFADDIVFPLYVSFLLPIFSLCYSAPSVAGEHEEQTLVYLLATPLPRPLIFAAKYGAALAAAMLWTFGAWILLSRLGGPAAATLFRPYSAAILWSTPVYVGLFCAFSVSLPRATIVSLVYVFFLEAFLGNVPGIAKRVAVSFYTQCIMLDAGTELGVRPTGMRQPALFLPLDGDTARTILGILAVATFLLGAWLFTRREYV